MTTLPRWSRRLSLLPLEPSRLKAGASRGGSKVPERRPCSARGGRRRAKWVPNATRGRTSAPTRSVLFIEPLQRDARRISSLHEAVVDVALEGNGALERSGLQGKLHQIVELLLDHPQISIGHAVGRVIHNVLDDRPVLIEVLYVGGDLGGPDPMVSLSIEPMAGSLHVVDEVLHQARVLIDELLAHGKDAADVAGPFVARHAQGNCVSGALRRGAIRLAGTVRVDCLGVERGWHVGRRHLDDSDVLVRHAFLSQHLAEKEKVDGEAAG